MLNKLEQKTADFIKAEQLIPAGEKVLLAVSGGADSTALLHIFTALRLNICCAHINHQLRGEESQRDEDFVIEQCRILNLPVITKKINVRDYAKKSRLSIETAARNLRIGNLVEIAQQQNCACIATAHHKNDNAETIIDRMIRGTGLRGLCGIWPSKDLTDGIRFIRPLLCAAREDIVQYLKNRKLSWCTDRTNADFAYRRNFIRHRLLPAVQKKSTDDIVELLTVLSKASRGFYEAICRTSDMIWPDIAAVNENEIVVNFNKIANQPAEVKIEIIRRTLAQFGCGEQDMAQRHYTGVLQLSDDAKLQLPNCITVTRRGEQIIFEHNSKPPDSRAGFTTPMQLNIPGKTEFAGILIESVIFEYDAAKFEKFKANKSNTVEWFDYEKLKLPLEVRRRKTGDKFWPLGLAGEKKVGKFLTTAKVSPSLRRRLIVVADSGKIIWLCPVRISEKAKVSNDTRRVIQIKISDE
jgi:tRNA(Ile)-lysidine synthase